MYTSFNQRSTQLPRSWSTPLALLLILALMTSALASAYARSAAPALDLDVKSLALAFVPNRGQANPAVAFQVHDLGGTITFSPDGLALSLPGAEKLVRLNFLNANAAATIHGLEQGSGKVSYLLGDDPRAWRMNLPTYGSLLYQALYPGVDLRYEGANGTLKGVYRVAAGADPGLIRWAYQGVQSASLAADGSLTVAVKGAGAQLVEQAPLAWQEVNGQRVPVSASYRQNRDGSFGFSLGAYNPALALTIDPAIVYSTFLGGSQMDAATGIAVDGAGNVYVAGDTTSSDWQGFQGSKKTGDDVFVLKLNPAGTALIYGTYLGGAGDDDASDIAVDGQGYAYVVGDTEAEDFPTLNGYLDDCIATLDGCYDTYLVKLKADGSGLLYGTYLGGGSGEGAGGVAVDGAGGAYVTGTTSSTDFPVKNAYQGELDGLGDAFVAKLNTASSGAASLVYGTYLGGGATEDGAAIAVDASGHAYVTGGTSSTDFPTTPGAYATAISGSCGLGPRGRPCPDIFVAKLSSSGNALDYSTYLGGDLEEQAADIAVDLAGNAHVTGSTLSPDFPVQAAAQSNYAGGGVTGDAFVAKLNSSGSSLVYSTLLGSGLEDRGAGLALDAAGQAYVGGTVGSPVAVFANPLSAYAQGEDAFLARLGTGGAVLFSAYFGGGGTDNGAAVAVDGDGYAYLAGMTTSSGFPVQSGAYDTTFGGGVCGKAPYAVACADGFVVKVDARGEVTPPANPELSGSYKAASQYTLAPTDELTYTIHLQNNGSQPGSADVSDVLPAELELVTGSITAGGSYDSSSRTLSWSGVNVPGTSSVALSYKVRAAVQVTKLTVVTNTARITSGGQTFERTAYIALVPEIGPRLGGSYKSASQRSLAPGETLTYTIHVYNNGTATASAAVSDPLPAELSYINGSANGGATYDAANNTLTWNSLSVPADGEMELTFQVEPAKTVDRPQVVINTATISFDGQTIYRKAAIVLLPERLPADTDIRPPVVDNVTIGAQDVLTDRQVMLAIEAHDDTGVEKMYIREWTLDTGRPAHWVEAQSSGWVDFQSSYAWTLSPDAGVHFIGVWVTDAAENKSVLNRRGMDFASLLQPDTEVAEKDLVAYMAYYEAGVEVTAAVTPSSGDPDLYVWYPGNPLKPDGKSTEMEGADTVSFTTPRAGNYWFVVYGHTAAVYDFTLTPAGGPEAWAIAVEALNLNAPETAAKPDELTAEPLLSQSGLDPLGSFSAETPAGPKVRMFIPILIRR